MRLNLLMIAKKKYIEKNLKIVLQYRIFFFGFLYTYFLI